MKTLKTTLIACLTLFTLSNCNAQWGKKIKGNGNKTTVTRSTSDYDAIKLAGSMDFELVKGKEGDIKLTGDSNLLKYIITESDGKTLTVRFEKNINIKYSKNNSIKISIPFEDISSVTLSGSGDVVNTSIIKADDFMTKMSGSGDITLNVKANTIKATVTGSGDVTLMGSVKDLEAKVTGSGDFHGRKLSSQNTTAKVTGSGTIATNTSNNLNARVTGSGDINYSGNPTNVDKKIIGSGDISKR